MNTVQFPEGRGMVDVGQGSSIRVKGSGAAETIQFLGCSPGKHEDLRSISSTTMLGGGMLLTPCAVCNPSAGEVETGRTLGLVDQPSQVE